MELSRNLRVESVLRLHPTPARNIAPEASVDDAVQVMRRAKVGCILVCDRMKLVGIFTERDLLRRILACGKPLTTSIEDVMTCEPVVVQLEDPIHLAVKKMQEGGYRHLPVVDDQQKAIGILSAKRIVHYLVEHFPAAVYNQPPNPSGWVRQREGA
jgi:signal-transduction protein with cAMP-binding, CBS, and nucleotidyltransferase domain